MNGETTTKRFIVHEQAIFILTFDRRSCKASACAALTQRLKGRRQKEKEKKRALSGFFLCRVSRDENRNVCFKKGVN